MNCLQVRDGLPLYVGGDLTDDERNAVDEHLQGCADCRVRLERTRAVIAPLRGLGPVDAPVPDSDVGSRNSFFFPMDTPILFWPTPEKS